MILCWISIIWRGREVSRPYHAKSFWEIWCGFLPSNPVIIRGFSPWNGERFLSLGPMWNALVRGWRSDCVVGGMETRFQWRKAHNLSAKCEAFHVAPRLFFMFLFLIPTTILATMYNYCHSNFPLSLNDRFWITYCYPTTLPNNSNGVASVISTW